MLIELKVLPKISNYLNIKIDDCSEIIIFGQTVIEK